MEFVASMKRGMAILVLMICISPAAIAFDIQSAVTSGRASFHPKQCWFNLTKDASGGRTFSCGEFVVPEHWDKPNSAQIHLPVVRFHANRPAASTHPVLFIDGGPGGRAGVRDALMIEQRWIPFLKQQPWTADHDFIVMTQRGTNWSDSNLECPALRDPMLMGASREPGETEWSIAPMRRAYEACIENLSKKHDLSGYNVSQDARDIAALRITMGIDRWSLLGISYGSRRALAVMRDYPAGIESVVLDSVAPANVDPLTSFAPNFVEALERVFQACQDQNDCGHIYPESRKQLTSFLARAAAEKLEIKIENHPEYGTIFIPLKPSTVIETLLVLLYHHELVGMIPAYIDALERDHLDHSYVSWIAGLSLNFLNGFAEAALIVQSCNDNFDAITDFNWRSVEKDFFGLTLHPEEIQLSASLCQRFSKSPLPADHQNPVVSNIPTLLLSGYYDAVTPSSQATSTAKNLSTSYDLVFPDKSHAVLSGSWEHEIGEPSCPAKVMTQFLEDPGTVPTDPCLERSIDIDFDLPE